MLQNILEPFLGKFGKRFGGVLEGVLHSGSSSVVMARLPEECRGSIKSC